jgi:hypothetical protein
VIAKVAQQVLLDNVDIRDTLLEEWHKDSSQFMLKIKSTGKSYHTIDGDEVILVVQP